MTAAQDAGPLPGAKILTWSQCRQLAHRVAASERGPSVIAALRPRGMTGLWRARAPLPVQFRVAAAQGRLVLESDANGELLGLAVIEAPGLRRRALSRQATLRFWHVVDRFWDQLVLLVPGAVLVLAGVLWWLLGPRRDVDRLMALGWEALALAWIAVGMSALVGRELAGSAKAKDPEREAHHYQLYDEWGIVLFDVPGDPTQVNQLMAQAHVRARQLWARLPTTSNDPEPLRLYVMRKGVTSAAAQQIVERQSVFGDGLTNHTGEAMFIGEYPDESSEPPRYLGWTLWPLVLGVATLLVVLPLIIVTCETWGGLPGEGLRTYRSAFEWLVGQFFWQDAWGGEPRTLYVTVLGWSMRLLSIVVLFAFGNYVRLIRASKARADRAVRERQRNLTTSRTPTVAIVTALSEEFVAVRAQLDDPIEYGAGYVLGTMPSNRGDRAHQIVLTQQNEAGNDQAIMAVNRTLTEFPGVSQVLFSGIGAGVPRPDRPGELTFGDVVVGSWGLIGYDHVNVRAGGVELRRGRMTPPYSFQEAAARLETAAAQGNRPWLSNLERGIERVPAARPPRESLLQADSPRVHQGVIGSGDRSFRDAAARDALGDSLDVRALDMEGLGIASVAHRHGLGWLVVRGISDFGDEDTPQSWRAYASMTSAAYVRALLAVMAPWPANRSGYTIGSREPVMDDLT